METGLVIRKETKFDKIRKLLNRVFFKEEYFLEEELKGLLQKRNINTSKIIIPKEIENKHGKNNVL